MLSIISMFYLELVSRMMAGCTRLDLLSIVKA